jgi:hypothetical protein
METKTIPDIAEKINSDYKIPIKNIKKAIVVQDYFNGIKNFSNQSNQIEALKHFEQENVGFRFDLGADFENWTLIKVICEFYRNECLLIVLRNLIKTGIESGNTEQVSSALYSLNKRNFLNETLLFIPSLLEFAIKNNSLEITYELKQWLERDKSKEIFSEKHKCSQKIHFAEILILEKKRNLHDLLHELNHFNPNQSGRHEDVKAILAAINSILMSEEESKLAEHAMSTVNLGVDGKSETLAILALIELIKRYAKKNKRQ